MKGAIVLVLVIVAVAVAYWWWGSHARTVAPPSYQTSSGGLVEQVTGAASSIRRLLDSIFGKSSTAAPGPVATTSGEGWSDDAILGGYGG